MKTSDSYVPNLAFGLLLKGKPKVGKTILTLQFPKPWIADCDNNLSGAVRHFRKTQPNFKFAYDTVNVGDDGLPVAEDQRWTRLIECTKVAARSPDIQTIIWDSAASISDYLIAHILREKDAGKDKDKMTIGDWIPYRNMWSKAITLFRSVGKLFILTVHEQIEQDEITGDTVITPNIPSKLRFNLAGFFSDEWLLDMDSNPQDPDHPVRFVKTLGDSRRSLGSSLGLPASFVFQQDKFLARLNEFNEVKK